MRLMTEFESFILLEYLVRIGSVVNESSKLKESAIIRRSSLMKEW